MEFFINTPLARPDGLGNAYLKWDFEGIYEFPTLADPVTGESMLCYNFQRLVTGPGQVFDGVNTNDENLSDHLILETSRNYRFRQNFQLTAYQQSLSEKAFIYWNEIRENTNLTGNLFEGTPGKIIGNVNNINDPEEEVLGYFFVSDQAIIKRCVTPEEALYPRGYCDGQFWFRADDDCKNCLVRTNSSLEKPADWCQ